MLTTMKNSSHAHPILFLFVAAILLPWVTLGSSSDTGNHGNGALSERSIAQEDTKTEGELHGIEYRHTPGELVDPDHHNNSGHQGNRSHGHGIHVASWNFAYVKQPLILSIFLIVTAICKLGFHHAGFLSSIVPESCLLIILGTIVGAILHFSGFSEVLPTQMSPRLFFLILLPPIILESAYSLHDRTFAENLGTVLIYAVIGTIMNCFLLGPSLYGLARSGAMGTISISLVQCLVFSALIVAVDPVAVLAIFQEIGVNNVLYFLVFGESLLNDAVTVVIYNTMKAFNDMDTIPFTQILLAFAAFFSVSLGGLAIGLIYGILTSLLTKYTNTVRVVEPLAVFVLAYLAYLTAELFHFSGIISIIGCGLVQAQYAFHNVSHKSYTTVKYFGKMMSTTSDCIIFMFLGLALVREDHIWHTGFILWTLLLCFVYRFLGVYFLTFLANKLGRLRQVDYEEQFIMAYGGLRGAVAFSLCAMLDKERYEPHQPLFLTATLTVIIFTVFVQGITIKPLVKLLRIRQSGDKVLSIYEEINNNVTDHVMAGIEEIMGYKGHNAAREWLTYYDQKYLKHWLQRHPQSKDDLIMDLYQKIALQQHYINCIGTGKGVERYTSNIDLLYRAEMSDTETEYDPDKFEAVPQEPAEDKKLMPEPRRKWSIAPTSQAVMKDLSSELMDSMVDQHLRRRTGSMFVPSVYAPSTTSRNSRFRESVLSAMSAARNRTLSEGQQTVASSEGHRTISEGQDEEAAKPPKVQRRKSLFNSLLQVTDEEDENEVKENPTVDDIRKWMVPHPNKALHHKYDPDLTRDPDKDLLHHLYEKQRRAERMRNSMWSPRASWAGSADNVGERPVSMESSGFPDYSASSRQSHPAGRQRAATVDYSEPAMNTTHERQRRYIPHHADILRQKKGQLSHAATIDAPSGPRTSSPARRPLSNQMSKVAEDDNEYSSYSGNGQVHSSSIDDSASHHPHPRLARQDADASEGNATPTINGARPRNIEIDMQNLDDHSGNTRRRSRDEESSI